MRNGLIVGDGTRPTGDWSDFVELARRMSVPADVAIHEYMGLGRRRPALRVAGPESVTEHATVDS